MPGAEPFLQLIGRGADDADPVDRRFAARRRTPARTPSRGLVPSSSNRHRLPASHSIARRILALLFQRRRRCSRRTMQNRCHGTSRRSCDPAWRAFSAQPISFSARSNTAPKSPESNCAGVFVGDQPSDVERHLLRGDEIAPPDICRIDAKIGGGDVDQPFAEEIRLDASGAAIGSRRRLVGDMRVHLARKVRNPVWPRQELRATRRRRATGAAGIGADVDRDLAAQPDDDTVPVARDLQLAGCFARMIGRKKMLAPVLDPFHGPVEPAAR